MMMETLPPIIPYIEKIHLEYLTQYGKIPTFLVLSNIPLRMLAAQIIEISDRLRMTVEVTGPLKYKGMLIVYLQRDEWIVEVG